MGLLRAIRSELTSTSATSNRTDMPSEPRRQAPTPASPAQKAAAEHYRETGDSRPMWTVKSREKNRRS